MPKRQRKSRSIDPSDLLEGAVARALRPDASVGEIAARLRGDPTWREARIHQIRAAVLVLERTGVLARGDRDGVAVFWLREGRDPRTAVHDDPVSGTPQPQRGRRRRERSK